MKTWEVSVTSGKSLGFGRFKSEVNATTTVEVEEGLEAVTTAIKKLQSYTNDLVRQEIRRQIGVEKQERLESEVPKDASK